MKPTLMITFLLLLSFFSNAQEMKYKFGFLFRNSLSRDGTLYLVQENANGTPTYIPKTINNVLKGTITKRKKKDNHDTLFLRFWPIRNEPAALTADASKVNMSTTSNDFIFVINTAYWSNGKRYLQIPYRAWQFTATNLPFRILTKTGDLESEFLNANVTFLKVFGHTKIFQSEFIEPRNWSLSIGPYIGLSAIDNALTSKKEFGLNYGVNGVYAAQSFNFIAAFGLQNGFRQGTKSIQPYVGFGIGFKLIEFFTPEIKNDD